MGGHVREAIRYWTLNLLARRNGSGGERFLRPLYCHYVFDDQVEDFDRLIVGLKETGSFVDTDTCFDMVKGVKPIDGRYFHLSFDDGFRNVFMNALPVLNRHKVPAIFFVPSGLVGADWERTRRFCRETTRYSGVIEMVRWEELDQWLASGLEIGSHTKSHARFSAMSSDRRRMEDEIRGSKIEIEDRLRIECKYISWPYGGRADADGASLEMTRESGYRGCFGAYRGSVVPHETKLFSVPRHHFQVEWPLAHVKYFAAGHMEGAA